MTDVKDDGDKQLIPGLNMIIVFDLLLNKSKRLPLSLCNITISFVFN